MYNLLLAFVALGVMITTWPYFSFGEWVLHSRVMHRPLGWFDYPYKAHDRTHHVIFGADASYHLHDEELEHKIRMAWWNSFAIIAVGGLPYWLLVVALYSFGWPLLWLSVLIGGLLGFFGYYGAYEYMHYCMHNPKNRWIERRKFYQWLNAHHLLHHLQVGKNFNVVLPLADWWLGTLILRAKRPFDQPVGPAVPDVQPLAA